MPAKGSKRKTIVGSDESLSVPLRFKHVDVAMRKKEQLFKKGGPGNNTSTGAPTGKKLLTRVREILRTRSLVNGKTFTRFDDVADAFIRQMELGSFSHLKEFIEREEGKVPDRTESTDDKNIKVYIGMPLEGENAP